MKSNRRLSLKERARRAIKPKPVPPPPDIWFAVLANGKYRAFFKAESDADLWVSGLLWSETDESDAVKVPMRMPDLDAKQPQ